MISSPELFPKPGEKDWNYTAHCANIVFVILLA